MGMRAGLRPARMWRQGMLAAGLLLLAAVGGGGCGYHAPGRQETSRPAPRIHLASLQNGTLRPGLHGVVAAAIRRRVILDARMPLVEESGADLILGGQVTGYGIGAVAVDQADIGRRFHVVVVAVVTVHEREQGRQRFQGTFSGEAYYTSGSTVQGNRAAEDEAINRAAQALGSKVAVRLLEEW